MSNEKPIKKRTVRIPENELVDLIDNIVNEAVAIKKQEWINEQAQKNSDKSAILESKIADLEAKVSSLLENKK